MALDALDRTLFRHDVMTRWFSAFAIGLLGLLALASLIGAVGMLASGEMTAALVLLAMVPFMGGFTLYVFRDWLAKVRWRVALFDGYVALVLPAGRSYLAKPDEFYGDVAYADIEAVEWRREAYQTMGMEVVVHGWSIKLTSGRRIILGEDRPIPRSTLYTDLIAETGTAIAQAAGVPVRKLGEAQGHGGFLGLFGTVPARWPKE